jgi:hypothetical protein
MSKPTCARASRVRIHTAQNDMPRHATAQHGTTPRHGAAQPCSLCGVELRRGPPVSARCASNTAMLTSYETLSFSSPRLGCPHAHSALLPLRAKRVCQDSPSRPLKFAEFTNVSARSGLPPLLAVPPGVAAAAHGASATPARSASAAAATG